MSGAFDPYLKWLAILPEEQPPNHYRLLGVPPFLDDQDVIENAADQRMAHVRTFQSGQHSELSQKILNEISAAKIALLNPEKKAAYDQQLRSQQAALEKQHAAPDSAAAQQHAERPKLKTRKAEPHRMATNPASAAERQLNTPTGIDVSPRETSIAGRVARHQTKRVWRQPATMAVGAVLLLAVVVGAAVVLSRGNQDPKVAGSETKATTKSRDTRGSAGSTSTNRSGAQHRIQFGNSSQDDPKLRIDLKPPAQKNTPGVSALKNNQGQVTTFPGGKTVTTSQPPTSVAVPTKSETPEKVVENPVGGFALRFEAEDFVELAGSRGAINLDRPFTVELWIRLTNTEKTFLIFGDHCWGKRHPDDPEGGASGWALQVRHNDGQHTVGIQYALSRGSATHSLAPLPSPGNKWHHLAICSTSESARVYVDGKLSKAHPSIVRRIRQGFSSLYLGGLKYAPKVGFHGDIRAFRLSTADRYKDDFTPPAKFEKDSHTITLFAFDKQQATELTDLAGNHPGRISGAEWIRLEQASAATKLETPDVSGEHAAGLKPIEKRLPVPDEEGLKAKRALIAELFAEQIKAARSKTAKGELAQLLLGEGRRTQNDPAGRYLLFDEALNSAIESGNVEVAAEIVEALAGDFDVDALQLNAETLTAIARTVENNDQRADLARSAIELAEEAIRAERFDVAESLSRLASSAAGRSNEVELRKSSNSLRARVRWFKAGWEASQKATATLQEQSDNAEAHFR